MRMHAYVCVCVCCARLFVGHGYGEWGRGVGGNGEIGIGRVIEPKENFNNYQPTTFFPPFTDSIYFNKNAIIRI